MAVLDALGARLAADGKIRSADDVYAILEARRDAQAGPQMGKEQSPQAAERQLVATAQAEQQQTQQEPTVAPAPARADVPAPAASPPTARVPALSPALWQHLLDLGHPPPIWRRWRH